MDSIWANCFDICKCSSGFLDSRAWKMRCMDNLSPSTNNPCNDFRWNLIINSGKQLKYLQIYSSVVSIRCGLHSTDSQRQIPKLLYVCILHQSENPHFVHYFHTDIHFRSSMYTHWISQLYTWYLFYIFTLF